MTLPEIAILGSLTRKHGVPISASVLLVALISATTQAFGSTSAEAVSFGGVDDLVSDSEPGTRIVFESADEGGSIWALTESRSDSLQTGLDAEQDPILVPLPPPAIVTAVGLGVAWLVRRRMSNRST